MIRRTLAVLIAVAVATGMLPGPARRTAWAEPAETVVVSLRPEATVIGAVVRLGDIADVSTASRAESERLKAIDVTSIEIAGENQLVSARLVRIRLLLEGIQGTDLSFAGARFTSVTRKGTAAVAPVATETSDGVPLEPIKLLIVSELADRWLVDAADVDVQFFANQGPLGLGISAGAIPEIELPDRLEPGRVTVRVRWSSDGRIQRTDQLTVEARLRQKIVLAAASIPRGEAITPAHLTETTRMLNSRVKSVSVQQVAGLRTRRDLSPGDIVTERDLSAQQAAEAVVRARDLVKVTAKKGKLRVELQAAEALQAGRIGETIRLRNPKSNQMLLGTVTGPGEVEIVLN